MKPLWVRRPEILLCPNIPKPLHGVAPRVVLGDAWWDRERRAAYKRANLRCMACGVHKTQAKYHQWLEGHELYETDYKNGRATYLETVPLCHFCHNFIHDGRLQMLLQKKEIHHAKYAAILTHGEQVLREAGLRRPTHAERDAELRKALGEGNVAEWATWRLIVFGKEYPPFYRNFEEWARNFQAGA